MIVYARPGDNLIDQAVSITVQSGTPLTGYYVERLNNGSWAYPFKIAEVNLELRFAFSAPVLPAFSILGNSNLTVAAVLEGGAAPGGADVSASFAVPTVGADGFYSSPFIAGTGLSAKQYWRLRVTGNAAPIILGALHLGSTYRTLDTTYELSPSTVLAQRWKNVRLETAFGIELVYQQAGRREAIDGAVVVTAAQLADLEALHQAAQGSARPIWFVPNAVVNEAWLVRLGDDGLTRRPFGAAGWAVPLPVRVLSRGLPW